MQAVSFDTDAAGFARDVIEASRDVPVVVDFWAPWCAPCRVLKPVLEKLAAEHQGRFRLAKLDTDAHPAIAAEYGVRGIPNVKAFVDGAVAAEFTGALPESQVRQFLEKLIPSPAQQLCRAARDDVRAGRLDAAEVKFREALALDEHLYAARVDLAEVLLARGDAAAAAQMLDEVPDIERDDRARQLGARIDVACKAAGLADAATLAIGPRGATGRPRSVHRARRAAGRRRRSRGRPGRVPGSGAPRPSDAARAGAARHARRVPPRRRRGSRIHLPPPPRRRTELMRRTVCNTPTNKAESVACGSAVRTAGDARGRFAPPGWM